jgi:hypothetical protein
MPKDEVINLFVDTIFSSMVTLIIEPDKEGWPKRLKMACELINGDPGLVHSFCFLGSEKKYPCSAMNFERDAPSWLSSNENRVAIINPIFSASARQKETCAFVVLCERPPVDLADWLGTEILARTLFVSPRASEFGRGYRTLEPSTDVRDICERLYNPLRKIKVCGRGFAPLRWSTGEQDGEQTDGRVLFTDDEFRLVLPWTRDRIALHIQALCGDHEPELYISRQRDAGERHALQRESAWFAESPWKRIPEELLPVLESMRSGQAYQCGQCGEFHDPEILVCPSGGHVLRGIPIDTWLLFNKQGFLPLTGEIHAWPLTGNTGLITRNGELFTKDEGRWQFLRKLKYMEEVDTDVWALFNAHSH